MFSLNTFDVQSVDYFGIEFSSSFSLSLSHTQSLYVSPMSLSVFYFYPAQPVVLCSTSAYNLLHGIRAQGLEHPLLSRKLSNIDPSRLFFQQQKRNGQRYGKLASDGEAR